MYVLLRKIILRLFSVVFTFKIFYKTTLTEWSAHSRRAQGSEWLLKNIPYASSEPVEEWVNERNFLKSRN